MKPSFPELDGVPVYINPLVGPDTVVICLKGTPQVHFVADSIETVQRATAAMNEAIKAGKSYGALLGHYCEYPGIKVNTGRGCGTQPKALPQRNPEIVNKTRQRTSEWFWVEITAWLGTVVALALFLGLLGLVYWLCAASRNWLNTAHLPF